MKIGSLVVTVVVVHAVACNRSEERPAEATTTSAARVPGKDAGRRIATARCDRLVACNQIGTDKKFASRDACMSEMQHDSTAALRDEDCPRGVAQPELDNCLADIRNERCDNVFDAVDRLATCRSGNLCIGG